MINTQPRPLLPGPESCGMERRLEENGFAYDITTAAPQGADDVAGMDRILADIATIAPDYAVVVGGASFELIMDRVKEIQDDALPDSLDYEPTVDPLTWVAVDHHRVGIVGGTWIAKQFCEEGTNPIKVALFNGTAASEISQLRMGGAMEAIREVAGACGAEIEVANEVFADFNRETVYQDLALVDELDVAGNMFLGREVTFGGALGQFLGAFDLGGMRKRTAVALKKAELRVPDIDRPVRSMSGGQRQATAIVRTVFWGKRLLILDEPTAALGVDESEHALRTIDKLRRQGIPMMVVSHNLQHVFRMSDRIIVLRHGRVQADLVTADTSPEDVVGHITGAKVTEVERRAARVEAGV